MNSKNTKTDLQTPICRLRERRGYYMAGILYDARRIKAIEDLMALCEFAGESSQWGDKLWEDMSRDEEVFEAFIFYLENHNLPETVKCEGYSLIDLFIWQMGVDNLIHDTGKNTNACNKEKMILHTFRCMLDMKKDPENFIRRMQEGRGMDKL